MHLWSVQGIGGFFRLSLIASQVFCIAQSIAALLQCRYGFGKPSTTLSGNEIQSSLKVLASLVRTSLLRLTNRFQGRVCSNDLAVHVPGVLEISHCGIRSQPDALEVASQDQLWCRRTCLSLASVRSIDRYLRVPSASHMGQNAPSMH